MHHILLAVCITFIFGMVITTVVKDSLLEKQVLKSELSSEELLAKVEKEALAFAQELNPETDLNKITSADLYFFKNKRELEIIVSGPVKDHLLTLSFKNLSPGYGLREKLTDLTPAEGIYYIDQQGYLKTVGYFVKIKYPPESYKNYQRIDYDLLAKDTYMIGEKAIGQSFLQANAKTMKLIIYLILKLEKNKLRVLVYPDRPPLTMELGGTEFTSEIYKNLDEAYKRLNDLKESLKPKF